jgi:hypothetical protein
MDEDVYEVIEVELNEARFWILHNYLIINSLYKNKSQIKNLQIKNLYGSPPKKC